MGGDMEDAEGNREHGQVRDAHGLAWREDEVDARRLEVREAIRGEAVTPIWRQHMAIADVLNIPPWEVPHAPRTWVERAMGRLQAEYEAATEQDWREWQRAAERMRLADHTGDDNENNDTEGENG